MLQSRFVAKDTNFCIAEVPGRYDLMTEGFKPRLCDWVESQHQKAVPRLFDDK